MTHINHVPFDSNAVLVLCTVATILCVVVVRYVDQMLKDVVSDVEWVGHLSQDAVEDEVPEEMIRAHVPRSVPHIRDAVAAAVVELGRLRRGQNDEANRLVLSRFYRQWATERDMRQRDIAFYHDRFIASYFIKTEEMLRVERLTSSRVYRNNQQGYRRKGIFAWMLDGMLGNIWALMTLGRGIPVGDQPDERDQALMLEA